MPAVDVEMVLADIVRLSGAGKRATNTEWAAASKEHLGTEEIAVLGGRTEK